MPVRLPKPYDSLLDLLIGVTLVAIAPAFAYCCHAVAADMPRPVDRPRAARPHESYPDLDVRYETATTPAGFAVSMIVTQPKAGGRLPTLVFIPWLSCDTVDYPRGA